MSARRLARHRRDRGRALQGLRALRARLPAARARMSETRNAHRRARPGAAARLHGLRACLLVCPDFCFEVYRFDREEGA